MKRLTRLLFQLFVLSFIFSSTQLSAANLKLAEEEYFKARGVDVLVFNNWYNSLFSDSKISGVELIHHGVRTATNGDVRLQVTPEQWDDLPTMVKRSVNPEANEIEAILGYPQHGFEYRISVVSEGQSLWLRVNLDKPLPEALVGKAGFNLEFLPSAYFEKTWILDQHSGYFPLYPTGLKEQNDQVMPTLLGKGHKLSLAPTDPYKRVAIESKSALLNLYDGRSKAQNGWFVVRSLIPGGRTGKVLEWRIETSSVKNWVRKPVIAYSQVGYHPKQSKVAVIELDTNDKPAKYAKVFRAMPSGKVKQILQAKLQSWGQYKRYAYYHFDFSKLDQEGIYFIDYKGQRTAPIRIDKKVYEDIWHPTLDMFMPVQMDHVLVNEAYRVWHGASHLDDALQAPINHEHFDLYAQGPTTDTPYKPGEHIPGLNIGGWYDAGDYDIRTQTQYSTVSALVQAWEEFSITRDTTKVDYPRKFVDLHVADGKPDLLQQIEHGTLALIAQFRAVGHAIPGIIVPTIDQYTHLGDGLTMTDNLIYSPKLGELESDGFYSGKFDDRWAFTTETSALNFGSTAALAAASRALKGYNDELAKECLETAIKTWQLEQSREPKTFRHGNTTGRSLAGEELQAALELMVATGDKSYGDRFLHHFGQIESNFGYFGALAVRAIPYFDEEYKQRVRKLALAHRQQLDDLATKNPYGVVITEGGWAGNGAVILGGITNYYLHKAFPDVISLDDVFNSLHYILGRHPDSNLSFVSAVGAQSKQVAYGMNRADFSYIAGGIVPGILMIKPNFPENHEDWPFFWGQNEYVVNLGAYYLLLANAGAALLEH